MSNESDESKKVFIDWFKTTLEYRQLRWIRSDYEIFQERNGQYSVMCVNSAYQASLHFKGN